MYKWLDKATAFLLKFVYDLTKMFILFTMLARAFNATFTIGGLYIRTALFFVFSICISRFLSGVDESQREKMRPIAGAGIVLALVVGMLFNTSYGLTGRLIMGGYFVIVYMMGILFIREEDNTHLFFKRFFNNFVLIVFIGISIGIGQLNWYFDVLRPFYLVYFMSAVMNLVSMNLKSAYQEKHANIMQKSRRILAFNIITVCLLTLSMLILTVLFSSISLVWLEKLMRFTLMPVAQFGTWFSVRIRRRALRRMQTQGDEDIFGGESPDPAHGAMGDETVLHEPWVYDQYIEWGFFILIIAGLLALAYVLTRRIEGRRHEKSLSQEDEIRESLISSTYLKMYIDERLNGARKKVSTLFKKETLDLPRVRALYASYLKYLRHMGLLGMETLTPNEILSKAGEMGFQIEGDAKLTACYNAVKYGEMDQSQFDESRIHEIEKVLEKRNRKPL